MSKTNTDAMPGYEEKYFQRRTGERGCFAKSWAWQGHIPRLGGVWTVRLRLALA